MGSDVRQRLECGPLMVDDIKARNITVTGQYNWNDVIAITLLFLNETEFFNFCKDLLESHYLYGHLEAENLVRVRHSGAGKQSLQYPQRMAWDLPPGQHQLRWPTPDVSSLIFGYLTLWLVYRIHPNELQSFWQGRRSPQRGMRFQGVHYWGFRGSGLQSLLVLTLIKKLNMQNK